MSEKQEHRRRYMERWLFICEFVEWLGAEPPLRFLCRRKWKKWRDSRPVWR